MKVSEITEVTVLEAAIEQLSKKDGYDPGNYFSTLDEIPGEGQYFLSVPGPGPQVGATCAIGGIEQALWSLTRQNLAEERYQAAYLETAASRRRTSQLYAAVMQRLNALARKHPAYRAEYGDEAGGCPIENLTFVASKRVVLNVFKKALAGAQAA